MKYLGCGSIRIEKSMVLLTISKISDITDKIIPFLDKYTVQGIKYFDYLDFKRAVLLVKSKVHLTNEGLAQIRTIKSGMNKGRDYLKFSSENKLSPFLSPKGEKVARGGSSIEDLTREEEPSSLAPNLRVNPFVLLPSRNGAKRFYSVWCSNRLKSLNRIGPHDLDVISLIVGSLLSNSYLEKREHGLGIRIIFIMYSNNVEYLM